jgi:hypothetical protein
MRPNNQLVKLVEEISPTTYDSYEAEREFLPPTPRDLDAALRVCPKLAPYDMGGGPHTYADEDGVIYHSVEMEVITHHRRLNGPDTVTKRQPVWFRSYVKCFDGGHWEPPDYDEVAHESDDAGYAYPSLAAAVIRTKADLYEQALEDKADNLCFECYGSGEGYDRLHKSTPCANCGGLGYHPRPVE